MNYTSLIHPTRLAIALSNGEKRIGIENIGIALGHSKQFFFKRTQRESKELKNLKQTGFSGQQVWVKIIGGDSNQELFRAKTLGLRDFVKLVTYEATVYRNMKAIILLAVFAETGIEKILEDAFSGRSIDFILDKIVHYSQWTYEELEEVLAYNRAEVRALYH